MQKPATFTGGGKNMSYEKEKWYVYNSLTSHFRHVQRASSTTAPRSHGKTLRRNLCHQVNSLGTLTYRVRISEWLLVAEDTMIRSGYVR